MIGAFTPQKPIFLARKQQIKNPVTVRCKEVDGLDHSKKEVDQFMKSLVKEDWTLKEDVKDSTFGLKPEYLQKLGLLNEQPMDVKETKTRKIDITSQLATSLQSKTKRKSPISRTYHPSSIEFEKSKVVPTLKDIYGDQDPLSARNDLPYALPGHAIDPSLDKWTDTSMGRFLGKPRSGQMTKEEREYAEDFPNDQSELFSMGQIWVGGELSDALTESVIKQLFFVKEEFPDRMTAIYNQCQGHLNRDSGEADHNFNNIMAIIDTYNYVDLKRVKTVLLGECVGTGCLLSAMGPRGKREAYESACFLHLIPALRQERGTLLDIQRETNELKWQTDIYYDLMGKYCARTGEQVKKDLGDWKVMSVFQAIDYGLIDKVIPPYMETERKFSRKDVEELKRAWCQVDRYRRNNGARIT